MSQEYSTDFHILSKDSKEILSKEIKVLIENCKSEGEGEGNRTSVLGVVASSYHKNITPKT